MKRRDVCFSLLGCRVEINVLFCAALAILLWADSDGIFLRCVAAAALHELGHILAMRLLRYPPCTLRLTGFGARLSHESIAARSYRADFLVLIAGPLCNLLAFSALLLIEKATGNESFSAYPQLAIGAFNLLPIEPLDGGQAIHTVLCRYLSQERAQWWSNVLTFLFLLPLSAIGFFVLLRSKGNYSLLLLSLYLIFLFVLKRR